MATWTLTPDWPKPPLNMNDRLHHHAKANTVRAIRETAHWMARSEGIPACDHIEVAMIWTVPDRGRRDDENPVATLKPFCDGLVDAGVVRDDTAEYMTKLMPRIEYRKGVKGVRFVVRSIETTDASRPVSPLPVEKQTGVSSSRAVADSRPALQRQSDANPENVQSYQEATK